MNLWETGPETIPRVGRAGVISTVVIATVVSMVWECVPMLVECNAKASLPAMNQIPVLVFHKVRPVLHRDLLQKEQSQGFTLLATPKVGEQIQNKVRS